MRETQRGVGYDYEERERKKGVLWVDDNGGDLRFVSLSLSFKVVVVGGYECFGR